MLWKIIKAILFGLSSNDSNTKEKEMNYYGLDEKERELVRKGDYEPWNFEEPGNLDEDDYYYNEDDEI